MLAMMDARGEVFGSVPGLTRRANVTREECERALASFMAPDPDSRTPDFEGRRIEPIEGGWRLLNHAKYAAIRDEAERREYKRLWDKQHRPSGHARMSQSDSSPTIRQKSDQSDAPDHTNTNTNTKEQKKEPRARAWYCSVEKPEAIPDQVWADWISLRKAKRAPVNETVLYHARAEARKAYMTLEEFLRVWCGRGSQGLEADWLSPHGRAQAPPRPHAGNSPAVIETPDVKIAEAKKFYEREVGEGRMTSEKARAEFAKVKAKYSS